MNFLRRCCLLSYGRASIWNNTYYKDYLKPTKIITLDRDSTFGASIESGINISKKYPSDFQNTTSLIMWSQVRFSGCPRLHRDLEQPNFDQYRKKAYVDPRKTSWGAGDGKPGYTYVVGFFGLLCGSYAVKSEIIHFVSYMAAAADVLALASVEIDISKIEPGACSSFKWRGKPLFIKHRTPGDIELEDKTPLSVLRDPETPEQRTQKPEWLIVLGICTHLGCVPIPNSGDWPGGFYCPCHGSHYDNVGRARKGPAPLNLEVPPVKFLSDTLVLVG